MDEERLNNHTVNGFGEYISRVEPAPLQNVIGKLLKSGPLGEGLYSHKVYEAWNAVSGMGRYTSNRYLKYGKLYITFTSSVVKASLAPRRASLLKEINNIIANDEMVATDASGRPRVVTELIFR